MGFRQTRSIRARSHTDARAHRRLQSSTGSESRVHLRAVPSLVAMPTHLAERHRVYLNEFILDPCLLLYSRSAVYTFLIVRESELFQSSK